MIETLAFHNIGGTVVCTIKRNDNTYKTTVYNRQRNASDEFFSDKEFEALDKHETELARLRFEAEARG